MCFLRGAKKGAPPDRVMNPSTLVVWHWVPLAVARDVPDAYTEGIQESLPDAARPLVVMACSRRLFFRIHRAQHRCKA